MRTPHTPQQIYLGLLGLIFTALTVIIFLPYLGVILFAAVMGVILTPLQKYIEQYVPNRTIASSIMITVTLLFILIPISYIGFQLFREMQEVYQSWQGGEISGITEFTNSIEAIVNQYYPGFSLDISSHLGQILNWTANNIGSIVSGTLTFTIDILLFIFALFFFLRDGDTFMGWYASVSPLSHEQDKKIIKNLKATINSVIRGTLFIAIIQGALAGIGFAIFGINNVAMWGFLAAVSAILPAIGVGLVFIPLVAYLLITGSIGAGLGLALWGLIIVGLADNLLIPYFYTRGVTIHPLFILFSVLGGVAVIGITGFVLGPLILSVIVSLADMYREHYGHLNGAAPGESVKGAQ